jgi:hypothetical protein
VAFGLLGLILLAAGCKGWSVSQYVSPRVTGRVLDEATRQPIQDVQVARVQAPPRRTDEPPPKGGQLLEQARHVTRTSSTGAFVLGSEHTVAVFARVTWNSVTLSFQHSGYLPYITNLTAADATYLPSGEPVIHMGDVLMRPVGLNQEARLIITAHGGTRALPVLRVP